MPESDPNASPCVSVVIPCLNEEKTIAGCIEAAKRGISSAGISGEIIVSDNGSTDSSAEIARRMGAKVVSCPSKGYGKALRAGFAAARGEWILMGDADLSYDFAELPKFWEQIRNGYDLVMGTRLRGTIEKSAMPWMNRCIGNPLLSLILRVLFGAGVSDSHCGMRAFRRDALAKMTLRTAGMELASEIVIKASAAGLKITETPITLHPDGRGRPPHLRPFRDGWRHLRYMLMMAPNWLFILPGWVVTVLGALCIGLIVPGPLRIGAVTFDVHTMLLGMCLVLLGVYLVLTGLFVKVFTYTEGLGVHETGFTRAISKFRLEHGLLVSVILIVAGLAGDIAFLWKWKQLNFGDMDVQSGMRMAILYTTVLIVGVELFFASFFLSMLGISREDYIGIHDSKHSEE